ncbi:uncharacterized protein LOC130991860 [Salvia miltiorrhiza]|uniref:uncharacterized protein LOC130991860 n=1 Tax=Salvia miltiorrhiza TaxID=226208 RepID=UPI0025ABA1CA|nr:uncharacterized protein LOC130991860 [Salvia miltiorrhiza]
MEAMREIARSYYERASEAAKISIEESFAKLDVDGDGKICLAEFKKSVSSWLRAEAVFEKLDEDGDGGLNFDEFLCLHYMEKKVELNKCSVCHELLVGPYFSCLLCIGRRPDSYDLCCSCYRRHDALPEHEHSDHYMKDPHSLLMEFRSRTAAADTSQNKNDIEELREIAKAYYRTASKEVKDRAREFYQSMDSDGNGRVDCSEFLDFMSQKISYMQNLKLFSALDLDNNGTLDFFEVMTLYYIIKSGRPFCNGDDCGKFISGIFFSCVECFKNSKTSFDLCSECYRAARYDHNHDGQAQFLDNYTLLQAMRDPTLARESGVNLNEARTGLVLHTHNSYLTTNEHVHIHNHNAVVPAPLISKRKKMLLALESFELALKIGSISSTLCAIM